MENVDIKSIKDYYDRRAQQFKGNGVACCTDEESCCETSADTSLGCSTSLLDHITFNDKDVVVDLGSGLGHDLFEAIERIGPHGQGIGVDFTPSMIEQSTQRASDMGYDNIQFVEQLITNTGLDDGVADVVISNCVINLVTSKQKVFNEAYRLLRDGGQFVFADMITDATEERLQALNTGDYCACIGGATSVDEYVSGLQQSGFVVEMEVDHTGEYGSVEPVNISTNDNPISLPYTSVIFRAIKATTESEKT